ncbi:hypothetical protein GCM10010246_04080 [Streptomyces cuspidosporus]|uniref:Uncharacterized protein n=1 Tax=Streptomyces cuspidosporus TaxID=66882 RepID=A0ABN3FB81_9ACTN
MPTPGFATVEIRLTGGDEEIERGRSVPVGKHTVWVLTGDSLTDSGVTTVSGDGTVLGRSGDDSLPGRALAWFSLALDGGAHGRAAEPEITGSKLNGLWRTAALVV